MEVIVQTHHASVPERTLRRAELVLLKTEKRVGRATSATVRFECDGPVRRVELALRTPRRRLIIASGEARSFQAALAQAAGKLETQMERSRREKTSPLRKTGR